MALCLAAVAMAASSCGGSQGAGGAASALPVVASFAAQPASIEAGASSQLSWSVTGATSLALDPGIGAVTGAGTSVRPSATTTYTLTATNAAGSATSQATVTVTGGGTTGACNGLPTQLFPPGAPWNQAVAGMALDPESDAIVAYLAANHTASAGSRSPSTSTCSSPT